MPELSPPTPAALSPPCDPGLWPAPRFIALLPPTPHRLRLAQAASRSPRGLSHALLLAASLLLRLQRLFAQRLGPTPPHSEHMPTPGDSPRRTEGSFLGCPGLGASPGLNSAWPSQSPWPSACFPRHWLSWVRPGSSSPGSHVIPCCSSQARPGGFCPDSIRSCSFTPSLTSFTSYPWAGTRCGWGWGVPQKSFSHHPHPPYL